MIRVNRNDYHKWALNKSLPSFSHLDWEAGDEVGQNKRKSTDDLPWDFSKVYSSSLSL